MAMSLNPLTPRIPDPPKGFFSSMSFSDIWQTAVFVGATVVMMTRIQAAGEHESEMRRSLESRTLELISNVASRQTENGARFDQRFLENATRNREALTELKASLTHQGDKLDSLGSKLDTLAATAALAQQPQQDRKPSR